MKLIKFRVKNNVSEVFAARVKEQKKEGQTASSQQQKVNIFTAFKFTVIRNIHDKPLFYQSRRKMT